MVIKNLNITKFRAVENVALDFSEGINAIGGDNGVGKTTIVDSILWVLADETLKCGKTNNSNLDDNDNKKPVVVEMLIEKANGVTLNLKREYQALFKPDGSFKDYSNKFYINDASYTSKEYFNRLKTEFGLSSCPEVKGFNVIRALIDFDYFGTIEYKIAREFIEKILKLESPEDIINQEKYRLIKTDLIGQNYDIAKTKTMLNKNHDIKEYEIDKLVSNINEKRKSIEPIDTNKLQELQTAYNNLLKLEFQHTPDYFSAKDSLKNMYEKSNLLYAEIDKMKKDLRQKEYEQEQLAKPIEEKRKEVERLREKFIAVSKTVTRCPKCQYELNGEEIKKTLSDITLKGKTIKAELEQLQAKVGNVNNEDLEKQKNFIEQKENEYKAIVNEQNALNEKLSKLIDDEEIKARSFNNEKQEKLNAISQEINEMKAKGNSNDIDKLEQDLENLKNELAKIDVKKQLVIDFEKEKINAIQNRVDGVFPGIDFVLTEVSDRGAETKTCKPTYKNVDYQRLNDGQRIMIGFEIIKDLNNELGIEDTLPIIFDRLRDLSQNNVMSLKDYTSQLFTTFVNNDTNIKLYKM